MALAPTAKSQGETVKSLNSITPFVSYENIRIDTDLGQTVELGRAAPGTGEEIDCHRRKGMIASGGA